MGAGPLRAIAHADLAGGHGRSFGHGESATFVADIDDFHGLMLRNLRPPCHLTVTKPAEYRPRAFLDKRVRYGFIDFHQRHLPVD
jgi:hypothetical protein